MSYPPPPGISSLPARPPASNSNSNKSSFKPAFAFTPSSVAKHQPPPRPTYSAPSYYSGPSQPAQHGPSSSSYGAVSAAAPYSYGQQPQSYNAAPQIQNPFPVPGTASHPAASAAAAAAGPAYDPEMAAQIAQWQSAYVTPDGATATAGPGIPPLRPEAKPDVPHERTKTVVREGGGKKWQDDTLLEWDPSHLRLFVGNLAGETTDDALLKAFSRWPSVQKARVIREKRTNKSKGYGFVSFSDADDYFQAAKEMNGKYIQSHPVTVRKANTEIKVSNVKDKHFNKKKGHHGNNYGDRKQGSGQGAKTGAGVTKPGQKTKNGLKLLG